jgi:DNA-binding response OmpR family regulator
MVQDLMYKIFIIDDDKNITEMLDEYLSQNGFQCFVANNSNDIFSRITQVKPDIIVCDIIMVPLSGFDIYYRLKQDVNTVNIPFVLLSAQNSRDDIIKGLQMGAIDYITKPINLEELKERLTILLKNNLNNVEKNIGLLLADSSKVIIKKTQQELNSKGYKIDTTQTIEEGLNICKSNKIDIVISGINLRGGTGYSFCQQLKKINPEIYFMLLISEGNYEALSLGNKAGVDDFVLKNLGVDGLLVKISNVIKNRQFQSTTYKRYKISEKNILSVLQACEIQGFTGKLIIKSPMGNGEIEMQRSEYIFIKFNDLEATDALEALAELQSGEIIIKPVEMII